ncbi:MAG: hypothetical protein QNJ41_29460 [Xenococcaceae cyanobacterium MO_188.B32]|nr:hypothetical protein [Xenococcaceae cyanobacterium MO_188.B32]
MSFSQGDFGRQIVGSRISLIRFLESLPTPSRNLQKDIEITKLWQDTNPLVSWLSRLRSPLEFDAQIFIRTELSEIK